jgi:CheY-like chemotaxis protein
VLAGEALPPASPLRDDLGEISRAAERATELTRQLLAFGRKQVLRPRVVDLNQIVIGLEKMLRRLVGDDVSLSLVTAPDLGKTLADPGQIEQVLMNLIVNARDAMPVGGAIVIETANAEHAPPGLENGAPPLKTWVTISVTDSGSGMDAATRARIFEPFFTTKLPGKGTGLGLSTVWGIVTQSDGHVSVESELGRGTTFRLYLPRVQRELDAPVTEPEAPMTLSGTETVLVVEDDEQVRALVKSVLRRNGYRVLEAQNGGEAFLISEQFKAPIALLLTDVVMPRMSGRELAQRILTTRPDMRVLYVSGYTEDSTIHHGVFGPGVALLSKPITPDTLLRKLRAVLDA